MKGCCRGLMIAVIANDGGGWWVVVMVEVSWWVLCVVDVSCGVSALSGGSYGLSPPLGIDEVGVRGAGATARLSHLDSHTPLGHNRGRCFRPAATAAL